MDITYPYTIQNCIGEKLIFTDLKKEYDGDRLVVENYLTPGKGPKMHTHWMQDKALKVIKGKLGYQVKGQPKQYATEGEIVFFKRGTPHRFWNAGHEELHCKGWMKPANTVTFFLSSLYDAQNRSGKAQPEQFVAAYLVKHYSEEYDIPAIPRFARKTIMPVTYFVGKLLGMYERFKNAPEAIKPKKYYH